MRMKLRVQVIIERSEFLSVSRICAVVWCFWNTKKNILKEEKKKLFDSSVDALTTINHCLSITIIMPAIFLLLELPNDKLIWNKLPFSIEMISLLFFIWKYLTPSFVHLNSIIDKCTCCTFTANEWFDKWFRLSFLTYKHKLIVIGLIHIEKGNE